MSSSDDQDEPPVSSTDEMNPNISKNPPKSINQSPVVSKIAPYSLFAAQPLSLAQVHRQLVRETAGHYVGPMPPAQFLDDFMPWNSGSAIVKVQKPSKARMAALSAMATASSKEEMYPHLISALTNWPPKSNATTVRLRFEDSHLHRDRNCQTLGVGISAYSMLKKDQQVPRTSPGIMDFANVQTWVELKPDTKWDAFRDPGLPTMLEDVCEIEGALDDEQGTDDEQDDSDDLDVAEEPSNDPRESAVPDDDRDATLSNLNKGTPQEAEHHPFENNTQHGRHTRGQLASYAGATMSVQFRNHLLTILICKNFARFIRWDRSCAIVTRAFDYSKNPLLFFEFFARFSQLTREQRGLCPSIRPARKSEANKARMALEPRAVSLWLGKPGSALKNVVSIKAQPFLVFNFQGQSFVIPAPHCDEYGLCPFGRATRCRAVVCISGTNPVVLFMKDYWREPGVAGSGVISEAEVYARFRAEKIKHVASMYLGGDVDGLKTDGLNRAKEDWAYQAGHLHVPQLVGHCIILNEVGRGLLTFRTAHDLIACIGDAVEAYEEVLDKLKIMHRDFSPDNVMMMWCNSKRRWGGLLIDWDHCLDLNAPNSRRERTFRTGKWHFFSAALAERRTSEHSPIDDRESVYHSFLWSGLCHLKHNLTTAYLQSFLASYDEMLIVDGHTVSGGAKRRSVLTVGGPSEIIFDLEPLNILMEELCWMFSARYEDRNNKRATSAMIDARLANLDNPAWLVGVLREAERELYSLWEDRCKEVCAASLKQNNGAVDNDRLDTSMASAEMCKESDWVKHVLRLEPSGEPGIEFNLTRPWDAYTKRSHSKGPFLPSDDDDEQPKRKKRRT